MIKLCVVFIVFLLIILEASARSWQNNNGTKILDPNTSLRVKMLSWRKLTQLTLKSNFILTTNKLQSGSHFSICVNVEKSAGYFFSTALEVLCQHTNSFAYLFSKKKNCKKKRGKKQFRRESKIYKIAFCMAKIHQISFLICEITLHRDCVLIKFSFLKRKMDQRYLEVPSFHKSCRMQV